MLRGAAQSPASWAWPTDLRGLPRPAPVRAGRRPGGRSEGEAREDHPATHRHRRWRGGPGSQPGPGPDHGQRIHQRTYGNGQLTPGGRLVTIREPVGSGPDRDETQVPQHGRERQQRKRARRGVAAPGTGCLLGTAREHGPAREAAVPPHPHRLSRRHGGWLNGVRRPPVPAGAVPGARQLGPGSAQSGGLAMTTDQYLPAAVARPAGGGTLLGHAGSTAGTRSGPGGTAVASPSGPAGS